MPSVGPSWLKAFLRCVAAATMDEPDCLGKLLAYGDIVWGFAVSYYPAHGSPTIASSAVRQPATPASAGTA